MSSVPPNADASAQRVPIATAAEWPNAVVEPRSTPTVERRFRWRTGLVPTAVPYICPHPWAYRPFLFLMNPALEGIDRTLSSQICFVVSRDNACRFCYGSFRTALRVAGYSEAELDRLEHDLSMKGTGGADHEALHFALTVSRGRFQDGPSVETLSEAGYQPTAIREIVGITVLAGFVNRMGTMLAVPVNKQQEQFAEQWYFRVLRPVWSRLLSGWRYFQKPQASPLGAGDCESPLSEWTTQLGGTHVGRVLQAVTTAWVDDGALPLRTKLLMLAVVARGLDDDALSDRVKALLAEQCGLGAEEVEAAVNHLRGDGVRPKEEALLPLARASILYEAGRIQQTVRDQTVDLTRSEIIDAVATLGLSNALARLHALAPLNE